MFVEQIAVAIDSARTSAQLDQLSKAIWQGVCASAINDDDAHNLIERIQACRTLDKAAGKPAGGHAKVRSIFPLRRYQRSPDRSQSIERRRGLAASGPMPPSMAAKFTTGELAVLSVIGTEVRQSGHCGLCVDAIAARAGVCRRLAQNALRLAEHMGLIVIQERRHKGRKNDPNLIRVTSPEWLQWLSKGARSSSRQARGGIGCKTVHPTNTKIINQRNHELLRPGYATHKRGQKSETDGARPTFDGLKLWTKQ